jgi:hypothetical protein
MIFTGKVWTVGKRRTHLLIVEPATRILTSIFVRIYLVCKFI